ncbi:MAG TPA: DUF192 domain-containing protein [Abditibacteriaceae bacterium]|nr:DUF192 domain-containing protein [Abditibacteriaceae bacterium]
MRYVRLSNHTRQTVLCEKCGVADNMFTRGRGLLGKSALPAGEGLLIIPCPAIHMFGMRFALDVIFLTRENIVTDCVENIAPGKLYVAKARGLHSEAIIDPPLPAPKEAMNPYAAVELPVGTIARTSTQIGDQLAIKQDMDAATIKPA